MKTMKEVSFTPGLPEKLVFSGAEIFGNGHNVAVVTADFQCSSELDLRYQWERKMAAELSHRYNTQPDLLAACEAALADIRMRSANESALEQQLCSAILKATQSPTRS